jgi:ABC-2 type transport system ATP-binding protein
MMVRVDSLAKYYGNRTILEDVTFNVNRGDLLGVFGSKGSGKTTLIRILTAYTPPSKGRVTIAGYDVCANSMEVRKRVGYLPANASLYTDLTIQDYLNFVARLRKLVRRNERVEEVLALLDLGSWRNTLIGKLSESARRRVGLAQAILHQPDVIILDEPTQDLDPIQIVEIHRLIKQLKPHYTIIFSSQSLPEIEQLCNRVLFLNQGRLLAVDTPASLVARLEA